MSHESAPPMSKSYGDYCMGTSRRSLAKLSKRIRWNATLRLRRLLTTCGILAPRTNQRPTGRAHLPHIEVCAPPPHSVAMATIVMVSVIAGVAGTLIQARTARKQRDFALRELTRAERINRLNEFLLTDAMASGKPVAPNDLLDRERHIIKKKNYATIPQIT